MMQNKIKTVHFEIDENGKFYFNEESIHRIGRLAEHLLVNAGVITDDKEITTQTIEHLKYEAPDQFNTDVIVLYDFIFNLFRSTTDPNIAKHMISLLELSL